MTIIPQVLGPELLICSQKMEGRERSISRKGLKTPHEGIAPKDHPLAPILRDSICSSGSQSGPHLAFRIPLAR